MKTYIGMKVVQAVPVKLVNGCIWPEGLPLPESAAPEAHEDACSCGNEVRAVVQEGYSFRREDGYPYPEWMTKEDFEKMFRPAEDMTFGDALEAVKQGHRAARRGWNGKGMYIFLGQEVEFHTMADLYEFADQNVEVNDLLILRTAQGTLQPGWLASRSDMLAEDWYIVE